MLKAIIGALVFFALLFIAYNLVHDNAPQPVIPFKCPVLEACSNF